MNYICSNHDRYNSAYYGRAQIIYKPKKKKENVVQEQTL